MKDRLHFDTLALRVILANTKQRCNKFSERRLCMPDNILSGIDIRRPELSAVSTVLIRKKSALLLACIYKTIIFLYLVYILLIIKIGLNFLILYYFLSTQTEQRGN